MRHNLDLLLLLYWMFMTSHARSTLTPKFDIGICSTEPLACCTGYRKEDGECKECGPGTYGENCSINCPEGWYGLFCKEKCRCFPCNYVNGCSSDTNLREGETDFINWKTVVVSTFASFSVCVVVGIMCYKLSRRPTKTGIQTLCNPVSFLLLPGTSRILHHLLGLHTGMIHQEVSPF
ncbi:scavenger receptor class F member 2-like [Ostrea edulis]|uniref:scavenger receptor class F member 2-like n=1 Tax=Ostrea edulis TaxID=37623 RepID=UPI0024AFA6CE|nr:scavenger receptor class F member 2-like [Ostrea edulis]